MRRMNIRQWDRFKLYETSGKYASVVGRAIRKIVDARQRAYCNQLTLESLNTNKKQMDDRVVVSLTTFPARIGYVHMAVKSLLNQTVKPERLLLWLAKDQFRDVEIPDELKELCAYGLEIRYCDEDILAHKKYYYAMREFPEHIIVTYDDDIIYPEDSLEKLLRMHKQHPRAIVCNRGREIKVENGEVAAYRYWRVSGRIPAGVQTYHVMASTGAGTLYPPHCMPEETFDLEKIRTLALTADDLWMKAMSIKGEIPVVKSQTRCKALCLSKPRQNVTLAHKNVDQNLNDHVMQKLLEHYPEIKRTLLEDVREE